MPFTRPTIKMSGSIFLPNTTLRLDKCVGRKPRLTFQNFIRWTKNTRVYVLDENKTILAKNISVEQLKRFMESELNK
jgi:hypothetical protein